MHAVEFAAQKTVRLTTRGRKSGAARTVTVWFVASGPRSILVQHTAAAPANWYRNLLKDPAVRIDFGDGAISARAVPISEADRIREILALVRRKYWSAWIVQLLGRGADRVAAEIRW